MAFRITYEEFINFDLIHDEIEDELGSIFNKFNAIDLVIDCRVCLEDKPDDIAEYISNFIKKFCQEYSTRKIIITGSSIPASISEILKVNSKVKIERVELKIFDKVATKISSEYSLTLGDYCAVSPNYSDINIPGGAMRNITAPKIIYPHKKETYITRGSALATHPLGNGQYRNFIASFIAEPFFRGEAYSYGESYLEEKSRGEGSGVTPSTMVKL